MFALAADISLRIVVTAAAIGLVLVVLRVRSGRTRIHRGNQFLNALLAPVPCGGQHLGVIRRRQMRREHANGSQREIAAFESLEHFRIAPRRPCGFDTVVCRSFGQMQHVRAVGEE